MATTPPNVDSYAFNQNHYSNVSIKVPQGCKASYQSSEIWRNFTNISEFVSLNDALNIGVGSIQFVLSGDYNWFTESEGGRDYAKSGNDGAHNSTSVLTATVTAFCGPISFIGLAVPHIARLLLGSSNHNQLIPVTILAGAVTALLCNFLTMFGNASSPLPLNAVTSIVGAPVIIYVIMNRKNIQYFN